MASTFLQLAATDPSKLACPKYEYADMIKPPSRLGMGPSAGKLAADVGGIGYYARLLISGETPASTTGRPLGDKCFLKTGGQCTTPDGRKVQRSLYIDNVPSGKLKSIGDIGMGITSSKGLIPGIAEELLSIDVAAPFAAFTQPANPPCTQITASVVGQNGRMNLGTGFVTNRDIKRINSCNFPGRKNPISGEVCKEPFVAANEALLEGRKGQRQKYKLISDPFSNIYTAGVGLLLVYLLYRLIERD